MLSQIKNFFTHKEEKLLIGMLSQQNEVLYSHLIAISRLLFLKPTDIKREMQNTQANTEYVNSMINETEKPTTK